MPTSLKNLPHYLYILYDPTFISKRFYIGISHRPLERMEEHIEGDKNDKKRNWITKMARRNIVPTMYLCFLYKNQDLAGQAEIEFISFCRKLEIKLCNLADGGNIPPHKFGENHNMAKLTWNQVNIIREDFFINKITRKELAKRFNVSTTTIKDIIRYKIWTNNVIIPDNLKELIKIRNKEDDAILSKFRIGENHPSFGKKASKETRKKLSDAHKGQVSYNKGKPMLPQVKEALRVANLNNIGENCNASKLTSEDVLQIRQLYSCGEYSYTKLAILYNINRTNVYQIIKRKTWKHI